MASNDWILLTGVGLPLLTVIAISLSGNGMQQLASHVHPLFGILFTVVVYIAIGPSMGIPRVANVAYEMGVSSFLPETIRSSSLVLFVYTIIFFAIVFWLSLNPSKLVDRIGNILTPILLLSIFLLFVKSVFTPLGQSGPAMQEYQTSLDLQRIYGRILNDGYHFSTCIWNYRCKCYSL